MIVSFVGGPLDGETRELPPNTWTLTVPVMLPDVALRFLKRVEPWASPCAYAEVRYWFSWDDYRMHVRPE